MEPPYNGRVQLHLQKSSLAEEGRIYDSWDCTAGIDKAEQLPPSEEMPRMPLCACTHLTGMETGQERCPRLHCAHNGLLWWHLQLFLPTCMQGGPAEPTHGAQIIITFLPAPGVSRSPEVFPSVTEPEKWTILQPCSSLSLRTAMGHHPCPPQSLLMEAVAVCVGVI